MALRQNYTFRRFYKLSLLSHLYCYLRLNGIKSAHLSIGSSCPMSDTRRSMLINSGLTLVERDQHG